MSRNTSVTRVDVSSVAQAQRVPVHLMPCEIEHDGPAHVSEYLTATTKDCKLGTLSPPPRRLKQVDIGPVCASRKTAVEIKPFRIITQIMMTFVVYLHKSHRNKGEKNAFKHFHLK